jgi:hypothetical protein
MQNIKIERVSERASEQAKERERENLKNMYQ